MLRRWTIRTRVLFGVAVPLVALVAIAAIGAERGIELALGVAFVVTVAISVAVLIARSISRPLTVLAHQAADVNALHRADLANQSDELLPPVDVERGYGGEIGQLAGAIAAGRHRALTVLADQRRQQRTLQELATNQAERTNEVLGSALGQLDELARRDHDSATAASLSAVQRLVARGDRHSAGVLALLGRDAPAAAADTPVAQVLWAACLAVDAAERIELVSMQDAWVTSTAVNDLAHLLAEILENAAQATDGESAVTVLGECSDIGYLLTVVDRGDGLDTVALAEANRRAGRAAPIEQLPARALGLDIVGRLARRHGILVRLGEAADGGIVVRVEVPAMLLAEVPSDATTATELLGAPALTPELVDLEPVSVEPVEPVSVEPVDAEIDLVSAEVSVPEPVNLEPIDLEPIDEFAAVDEEPIVVEITAPPVPIRDVPGLGVPSIVIDPLPYVVRVSRSPDELLPSGQRKKRWAAALAKAGANN